MLVLTGESTFQGFLGGAISGFRFQPSTVVSSFYPHATQQKSADWRNPSPAAALTAAAARRRPPAPHWARCPKRDRFSRWVGQTKKSLFAHARVLRNTERIPSALHSKKQCPILFGDFSPFPGFWAKKKLVMVSFLCSPSGTLSQNSLGHGHSSLRKPYV